MTAEARSARAASASISAARMRPVNKPRQKCAPAWVESGRCSGRREWESRCGGSTGSPSTRTTWQPTPSDGVAARQIDGFVGGAGPRHQRSAGQHAGRVQFDDGAIHAGGQPEIIGVDNEAAHRLSLSTGCGASISASIELALLSWQQAAIPCCGRRGRLAQLVRAPALQAGSRGFESLTAHHSSTFYSRPRTVLRSPQIPGKH